MTGDRDALQRLLTTARARANPASFPQLRFVVDHRDARGRRAENMGLTQDMMDMLLGRSIGSYGAFERGRKTPEHLFADVARLLAFSHQEWTSLWRYAAGKEPPYALDTALGLGVAGAWQLLVDATSTICYINDRDWNVVVWNNAVDRLFAPNPVPGNMMKWILTHPDARVILAEWDTYWAPALVAELRAAHALHPESGTLARLVEDARRDPEAGPIYDRQHLPYVQPQADAPRPMLHPEYGNGWVYVCGAAIFGSPSARMMQFPFFPGRTRPEPLDPLRARRPYEH